MSTPPGTSQRAKWERNNTSKRWLPDSPNSASKGGYISERAYVYDTGRVFTVIWCTCIGEDRKHMKGRRTTRVDSYRSPKPSSFPPKVALRRLAIMVAIQDATDFVARALRTGCVFQHRREARTRQSGRKRRERFQHRVAITSRRVRAFYGAQLAEQ